MWVTKRRTNRAGHSAKAHWCDVRAQCFGLLVQAVNLSVLAGLCQRKRASTGRTLAPSGGQTGENHMHTNALLRPLNIPGTNRSPICSLIISPMQSEVRGPPFSESKGRTEPATGTLGVSIPAFWDKDTALSCHQLLQPACSRRPSPRFKGLGNVESTQQLSNPPRAGIFGHR